jgi:hypothetical protein
MIMEKKFKFIVEVGYGQNAKAFVFEDIGAATDFALTAAKTARWGMDDVVIKIEKKQEEEQ